MFLKELYCTVLKMINLHMYLIVFVDCVQGPSFDSLLLDLLLGVDGYPVEAVLPHGTSTSHAHI